MGYGAASGCCIADATRYRTRCKKDDTSLPVGYGATSSCIDDATRYRTRYRKDDASLSVWRKKRDREQRVVVATRYPTRCRKDDTSLVVWRKKWDMERQVVVASLMQHGIELGVKKMIHHWQWDRERRGRMIHHW
jgi:hypothetical protein